MSTRAPVPGTGRRFAAFLFLLFFSHLSTGCSTATSCESTTCKAIKCDEKPLVWVADGRKGGKAGVEWRGERALFFWGGATADLSVRVFLSSPAPGYPLTPRFPPAQTNLGVFGLVQNLADGVHDVWRWGRRRVGGGGGWRVQREERRGLVEMGEMNSRQQFFLSFLQRAVLVGAQGDAPSARALLPCSPLAIAPSPASPGSPGAPSSPSPCARPPRAETAPPMRPPPPNLHSASPSSAPGRLACTSRPPCSRSWGRGFGWTSL